MNPTDLRILSRYNGQNILHSVVGMMSAAKFKAAWEVLKQERSGDERCYFIANVCPFTK